MSNISKIKLPDNTVVNVKDNALTQRVEDVIPSSASGSNKLVTQAELSGSIGTLDTTYSASQTPAASESLSGSIKLHKISKTGDYDDLDNLPTIPSVSFDVSGSMLVVSDPSLNEIELELASI